MIWLILFSSGVFSAVMNDLPMTPSWVKPIRCWNFLTAFVSVSSILLLVSWADMSPRINRRCLISFMSPGDSGCQDPCCWMDVYFCRYFFKRKYCLKIGSFSLVAVSDELR